MVAAETKQVLDYLLDSLMYQITGDEIFDEIVYWTSFYAGSRRLNCISKKGETLVCQRFLFCFSQVFALNLAFFRMFRKKNE